MAKPLQARYFTQSYFNNSLLTKPAFIIRVFLFTFITVISQNNSWAQQTGDYRSKGTGDWDTSSTWEYYNGTEWENASSYPGAPNEEVEGGVTVTILSGDTIEVNNLIIEASGILEVHGGLAVNGDLEMLDQGNNYSYLVAYSGSVIIIRGNVTLSNKTNIGLNSYFIVLGNFSFSNGGGASDFDIKDASIYVFGDFDKGGSSLIICNDYDNNTDDYSDETCHVGTDSAFYNNTDSIPSEIIEIVNPCNASANISGNVIICENESTDLSVALTGTQPWSITYTNGTTPVILNNITSSPHIITVTPSETTTYTLTEVSDANCTGTTSGSATITVNDLPQGSLSANGPFCGSGTGQLTWTTTTGTGPFTVVYNDGITDRTETGVVSGTPVDVANNPVNFTTTYTILSVTDDNGCTRSNGFTNDEAAITVNKLNMVVSDETPTPSGNHCPEFGGPFNANTASYNPGVTEVVFKVEKDLSSSTSWTFDFQIDETGEVEVYDLVVSGNNSAISYTGDDAAGSIDATDNTEVTFIFQIWNVPGTALDVDFSVTNGNDGNCDETGSTNDNRITHVINVMPAVGSFTP